MHRGNELSWKGELEDIKTDDMFFFCGFLFLFISLFLYFFVSLFLCFFVFVSCLGPLKREKKHG